MKLETFRRRHRPRTVRAANLNWRVIQTRGSGKRAPVLVMLPGTLGTAEIFWNQIAALGKRVRIVSVTYPEIGDIKRLADGLAALLDRLGVDKASFVGSSLGGFLGQWFAARHPERTRALVLVEPMPREALRGGMRWLPMFRPALIVLAGLVRFAQALGIARRGVEPMDLEQWDRATRSGKAPIERYGSVFSDLRSMTLGAYLQTLSAFVEPLPDLSQIHVPALVLVSTGSTLADGPRTQSAMAKLANAEIVSIPAGHWIPAEQPEAMRQAIDQWLERRVA